MKPTAVLVWSVIGAAVVFPVAIAGVNPLLTSRDAFWVLGGLAGVIALSVLLIQPLLAATYLPGLSILEGRQWHRWLGVLIAVIVAMHVGGLYLSSPTDMLDALTLQAPTAFSVFGVIAMWGVISTVVLVAFRSKLGLRYASWRILHNLVAFIIVVTSIAHALMIEGAMEYLSKLTLCALIFAATIAALLKVHAIKAGSWLLQIRLIQKAKPKKIE